MIRHCLPYKRSLRALDQRLDNSEAQKLGRMFATNASAIKTMTFANIDSASSHLVGSKPHHVCPKCCLSDASQTATKRLQYLGWRFTCPICQSLLHPADASQLQSPFEYYHVIALRGEKLLDDEAELGIRSWISPANLARFLLSRRYPFDRPMPMERAKVLGRILPGWDDIVVDDRNFVPSNLRSRSSYLVTSSPTRWRSSCRSLWSRNDRRA